MLKLFANFFWTYLPGPWQKNISYGFSRFLNLKISRLLITPSCFIFNMDTDYLNQFVPETGKNYYNSYSDFFRRKYKMTPTIESPAVWPCEGYVCDWGQFSEKKESSVKGQILSLSRIFLPEWKISPSYSFLNIFLHNHNYHRIHAPVGATVKNIIHIPGDLVFLRPWFYKREDVSYPAFRNERVTIELEDVRKKSWFVTLVGGFGVGSIELLQGLEVGRNLNAGDEMAYFKLGSTICIASPYSLHLSQYLQKVFVGQKMFATMDEKEPYPETEIQA